MDFFSRQDDAISRSRKFYLAFFLAMAFSVVVFYLLFSSGLWIIFTAFFRGSPLPEVIYGYPPKILSLKPFLIIGSICVAVILAVSIRRNNLLKEYGGVYVAELLGARPLENLSDFKENQLVNIVEEMAVAAGLPRPHVYILPSAHSINAITAGTDHHNTVIAVTEGALKHLKRDELQGVVAHEFAHILNGDYSLNLTMAGWLYGLMFIYITGGKMVEYAFRDASSGEDLYGRSRFTVLHMAIMVAGFAIMLGGLVGKTAARVVQAAFSRQREYLADAFAVQFTRNPHGLSGAMKKIAWSPRRGVIPKAEAMSLDGFFIVSPIKFGGLLQTHPPLEDRITALDPAWDGQPVPIEHEDFQPPKDLNDKYAYTLNKRRPSKMQLDFKEKLSGQQGWSNLLLLNVLAAGGQSPVESEEGRRAAAAALYDGIPAPVKEAAGDSNAAACLAAASFLSIDDDDDLKNRQIKILESLMNQDGAARVLSLAGLLTPENRLPVLEMAAPVLAKLPEGERGQLVKIIKALAAADGRLDLYEVAACQVLKKSLGQIIPPPAQDEAFALSGYLEKTQKSAVRVLSLLAWLSSENIGEAQSAFGEGMKVFNQWPSFELISREELGAKVLVGALDHLGGASDMVKKNMVLAAAYTALHDHQVSLSEQILLTAVASALDVPLAVV